MKLIEFDKVTTNEKWDMTKLQCHDFYEIYFLTDGNRTIFSEYNSMCVSKGCFAIIPPFVKHRTAGNNYSRTNIYVSSEIFEQNFTQIAYSKNYITAYSINSVYLETIFQLLDIACNIPSINVNVDTDKKIAVFKTIFQLLEKSKLTTISTTKQQDKQNDYVLEEIVKYIDKNFNKKITIDFLCQKFYFSKSNLCKKFKQYTKNSITDYLLFLRISSAKNLLYTTNKSLNEIASLCGFESSMYFSIMFKKKVGISPLKYRKTK